MNSVNDFLLQVNHLVHDNVGMVNISVIITWLPSACVQFTVNDYVGVCGWGWVGVDVGVSLIHKVTIFTKWVSYDMGGQGQVI